MVSDDDLPPLVLAGVPIRRLTTPEAIDAVFAASREGPATVAWVYANCINIARDDRDYASALRKHSFVFNDGAGIELAARLAGRPVRDNLVGTDWIPAFLTACAERPEAPKRVFLLGSADAVVSDAAALLARRWPQLTCVGFANGYFTDADPVLAEIAAARPDIVVVAMGVPRQEKFVIGHREALAAAGVRITLAGGAVLDYMTGHVPRAPRVWRRLRLEWVWRLLREPRRLFGRYVFGTLRYLGWLAGVAARGKLRRGVS